VGEVTKNRWPKSGASIWAMRVLGRAADEAVAIRRTHQLVHAQLGELLHHVRVHVRCTVPSVLARLSSWDNHRRKVRAEALGPAPQIAATT
jgi:hypothetical protein